MTQKFTKKICLLILIPAIAAAVNYGYLDIKMVLLKLRTINCNTSFGDLKQIKVSAKDFGAYRSEEINIHDQLYDIISTRKDGDSVILIVYHDKEEELLVNREATLFNYYKASDRTKQATLHPVDRNANDQIDFNNYTCNYKKINTISYPDFTYPINTMDLAIKYPPPIRS